MIKVNVISNNILWKKYFKNAHSYIDKKIKKINLKNKSFQKKKSISHYFIIWKFSN